MRATLLLLTLLLPSASAALLAHDSREFDTRDDYGAPWLGPSTDCPDDWMGGWCIAVEPNAILAQISLVHRENYPPPHDRTSLMWTFDQEDYNFACGTALAPVPTNATHLRVYPGGYAGDVEGCYERGVGKYVSGRATVTWIAPDPTPGAVLHTSAEAPLDLLVVVAEVIELAEVIPLDPPIGLLASLPTLSELRMA